MMDASFPAGPTPLSPVWRGLLVASLRIATGAATVLALVAALLVVLPLTLLAGAALRLRSRSHSRSRGARRPPLVIEGEYTVISNG